MHRCGSMNIVSFITICSLFSLSALRSGSLPFASSPSIGNSREWIFSIRAAQALNSGIFDVGSSFGFVN